MSLVVCALLAGLALGRLRGGSLEALGAVAVRRRRLAVAALLSQAAGTVVGGPVFPLGLAVSAALLMCFLSANRGVRGTGLLALGLLANAAVVVANGAMPVSGSAAERAGIATVTPGEPLDSRHQPADGDTRLPWLGDVVPVPLPLRPEVVSPGDVLVAAGLAQLVVLGMQAGGRQRPLPPPSPARTSAVRTPTAPSPRASAAGTRPRRPVGRTPPGPSGTRS